MTEPNAPQNGGTPAAASAFAQRMIGQYVRDLSFENIWVQKGLASDPHQKVSVQVNVDTHPRRDGSQHEVVTKLRIAGKSQMSGETHFLLEVEYAALFEIEGLREDQLRPYLLVECPRMTFPVLRRMVANVTQDAGYPPLILDAIDFGAIYRKSRSQPNSVS